MTGTKEQCVQVTYRTALGKSVLRGATLSDLPEILERLYKRRVDATAYVNGRVVGEVSDYPDGWNWYCETESE